MAKITYKARKQIRKGSFAVPGGTAARKAKAPAGGKQPRGSFPVTDAAHARNALARAHQSPHGPGSAADTAVHRKVREKFPAMAKRHRTEAHGRG